jgi:hypothetical protein
MKAKEKIRQAVEKLCGQAEHDGLIFWGFIVREDENGMDSLEAFANKDWNEQQICAATVEAIQRLDNNFVKEA